MSDNFTPGSEAQLNAALQAAAAAEASVPTGPLVAPQPLQSTVSHSPANAPDIRLLKPAADQGVTVEDDASPQTFEEAYAREQDHTLGTEASPDEYFDDENAEDATADVDPDNLTPEQRRIQELESEIAERDRQEIIDTATWAVEDKWVEGRLEFSRLADQVKTLGEREGRSEVEIERALRRVDADYSNWKDRYWPWRQEQLAIAEARANGIDAISTIISEHGLQDSDRARLQQYAKYGEDVVQSVARDLAAERAKLNTLTTTARRQAARNRGQEMANAAIAPPASGSPSNRKPVVTGSDAELSVIVANRPTRRGRVA